MNPKGNKCSVDPIRSTKDIKKMKAFLLSKSLRNYAIFVIGINTNLRASDLLRIRYDHVKGLEIGDTFSIYEKKTGKKRNVTLNAACIDVIKLLESKYKFSEKDYLFKSNKGKTLCVPSLHRLIKSWCKELKFKGNFGTHTLRKTWGYHQHKTFGTSLPILMKAYNHSTQLQTLHYLCIAEQEVKNVFITNQL